MRLIVEFEQTATKPGKAPQWHAYVRQGDMKGSDLLKGRRVTERQDAEQVVRDVLGAELEGYPFTLEFA